MFTVMRHPENREPRNCGRRSDREDVIVHSTTHEPALLLLGPLAASLAKAYSARVGRPRSATSSLRFGERVAAAATTLILGPTLIGCPARDRVPGLATETESVGLETGGAPDAGPDTASTGGLQNCAANIALDPYCYVARPLLGTFREMAVGQFVEGGTVELALLGEASTIVGLLGWDGAQPVQTTAGAKWVAPDGFARRQTFAADLLGSPAEELVWVGSTPSDEAPGARDDILVVFPWEGSRWGEAISAPLGKDIYSPIAPYRLHDGGVVDFLAVYAPADQSNTSVQRLRWTGSGIEPLGAPWTPPALCGAEFIVSGHLDADHHTDLVLYWPGCWGPSAGPLVMFGLEDGNFSETKIPFPDNLTKVLVGDLTGDGIDDILFESSDIDRLGNTTSRLRLVESNGDRSFQPPTVFFSADSIPNVQLGQISASPNLEVTFRDEGIIESGELRPLLPQHTPYAGMTIPRPDFDLNGDGYTDALSGADGTAYVLLSGIP